MTTFEANRTTARVLLPVGWLVGVVIWFGFSMVAAASVGILGMWALMLPVYTIGVALAVFRPAAAALSVLVIAIVLEPGAVDFTLPISAAFWRMPPGLENAVGLTTSPLEIVTCLAAVSACLRFRPKAKLPWIIWAVPAMLFLGLVYGVHRGGAANLAYNEGRGVIVAIAIVALAIRVLPADPRRLARSVMLAETALAASIIIRYLYLVRGGRLDVPVEFAFSHEGSVILGAGLVVGVLSLIRRDASLGQRVLLSLYCALLLAAMLVTGRRAATLVLLVGTLSLVAILFPRRPLMVVLFLIPLVVCGGAYLGAYWNKEYGATAQPARAIRSQFDPSLRDESSDQYRAREKANVIETIRLNRPFGVGLGIPFYQFQPLPDLTDFWPLQSYTPHQNILWLWLKMGVLGVSVFLGLAVTAMSRCLAVIRRARYDTEWEVATAAFTVIVMFLMYSTVDLGFIGARSVAPAAVACALAFTLKSRDEKVPDGADS